MSGAGRRAEPLEVHGDGLQSRDFTYIDNVVQGNMRAMETPGVSGEVFNIACNNRYSLLDIAEEIGKFLGRTLERSQFDVEFPDAMLKRSVFQSVSAIRSALSRLMAAAA